MSNQQTSFVLSFVKTQPFSPSLKSGSTHATPLRPCSAAFTGVAPPRSSASPAPAARIARAMSACRLCRAALL
jgi:hypothetical protein